MGVVPLLLWWEELWRREEGGIGKGVELIAKRMNDVFMKAAVRHVVFLFLYIMCPESQE